MGLWSLMKALLICGAILPWAPEDRAGPGQQPDPGVITLLYEMDFLGGGWQNGDRRSPYTCIRRSASLSRSPVRLPS